MTARNAGTNKEDTATTDDTGRFKVANLQPGIYAITVTRPASVRSRGKTSWSKSDAKTNLEISLALVR